MEVEGKLAPSTGCSSDVAAATLGGEVMPIAELEEQGTVIVAELVKALVDGAGR
jgi:hypothetical protein